jgi:pilus assembly protein CpaB
MQFATKLVSTRRGTLIAALLIALLAGASILLYLNSYRDSLKAQGANVTVLVAKQAIPKGTSGTVIASKGLYTVTTIKESQLLEGAMSDPATLKGKVSTTEIFEGAQLTATEFGSAGDSLAPQVADRQRVVSLPLDTAHGLVGVLEVGNHVDVFAGFNVMPLAANGKPIDGAQGRPILRKIISNVKILAIGEKGRGSGTTNVSVRLDNDGAAKAAFASEYGAIWLALRPSSGAKAVPPDLVTIETLMLGIPPRVVLRSMGGIR